MVENYVAKEAVEFCTEYLHDVDPIGIPVNRNASEKYERGYYGVIEQIWELDYLDFRVSIFLCKWVDSNGGSKIDDMGFTLVNLNHVGYKDDCFILGNQLMSLCVVVVRNRAPISCEKWHDILKTIRH
ncbi:hypothetical protein AXF42_Ash010161 [Apostasia shenzhenica]|uniref:DUF4216 domain-containing protein n=1 Tax=Apostasia shenzhenica TaxID=1088818 RepID=A0A2I0A9R4_9ASPA|nr:hypothetical protein AXF42_Ash010161 [Apostasia shenzhenica]